MKKNTGTIEKMIIPVIAILASILIIITYANNIKPVNDIDKARGVARNYILRMESNGYLRDNDEDNLIRELKSIGITNVSLTGTTRKPVGYSNNIVLSINGDIKSDNMNLNKDFSISKKTELIPVNIKMNSTAKN